MAGGEWLAELERARAAVAAGAVAPLYLLAGDEEFPLAELAHDIELACVEPGAREIDRIALIGSQTSPETVVSYLNTPPFLSRRRLVVVDATGGFAAGSGAEELEKALLPWFAQPGDWSTLVLAAAGVPRESRKLAQAAARAGVVIVAQRLREAEAAEWIAGRARQAGRPFAPGAAEALVAIAGTGLRMLAGELEKLLLYTEGERRIAAEAVRALASPTPESRVFDLMDAVGRRSPGEALLHLSDLLRRGEPPLRLLATLFGQARDLALVKAMVDEGMQPPAIAAELGWPPWRAQKAARQARAFGYEELERAVREMSEADEAIKTGRLASGLALELLVLGMARDGRPPPPLAS